MFNPMTIQQQYRQTGGDDLKILVVGAGIAGISVAQMMRRNGRNAVLIERNTSGAHPGYMLALMPMVDPLLDNLGVHDHYRDRSTPLGRYGFHDHKGRLIREDSMAAILDRFGDYRGIARGELLEVLTSGGCNVSFDTTVTAMVDADGKDLVTLKSRDETLQLEFDLIIIADGIHSATRQFLLGKEAIDVVDTQWGGWVVWAPGDGRMDMGEELWGAGFFYGVYPVKGALGVFLGGNRKDTIMGPDAFVQKVRGRLTTIDARTESCLQAVSGAKDPFFWSLSDCRCPQWSFGRTVLLGDAAAGFLPTAGIGAGMAMESAWVLARMLRYADPGNLPAVLDAYETAQKPRVESAQDNSRALARLMFRQSHLLAFLRDWAMRLVSVEMAIKPIQKLVANKPDPDRLAQTALGE